MRGHPIARFHDDTRDFAPILMPDVIRAGWDLDGQSKEIMAGLGITEQQLSIPAVPSPAAYDGWVLIAEARSTRRRPPGSSPSGSSPKIPSR